MISARRYINSNGATLLILVLHDVFSYLNIIFLLTSCLSLRGLLLMLRTKQQVANKKVGSNEKEISFLYAFLMIRYRAW